MDIKLIFSEGIVTNIEAQGVEIVYKNGNTVKYHEGNGNIMIIVNVNETASISIVGRNKEDK